MKNIVHIIPSFGCGGLEKVVSNLIAETHLSYKHTIISLSADVTMSACLPPGTEIVILEKKEGKDLWMHRRILSALRNIKPDVVHTYNFGTIEYQLTACIFGFKRLVHVDHGLGGDASEGKSAIRRVIRKCVSYVLDAYIVVSADLEKWVVKNVGVNSSKVHVIQNGISTSASKHAPEVEDGAGLSLITVGRMVEVKNQQALIRCSHLWNRKNPDKKPIHVYLVGDGHLRKHLEELSLSLGSQDTVHFMGQTMSPWEHVNKADAFILTSLYEAMPMTVLEAMSRSCPVLCSKVGGVSDFISDSEAILFEGDNEDALFNALDYFYHLSKEERQNLGVSGFRFVSDNYSQEKMVERYLKVWFPE